MYLFLLIGSEDRDGRILDRTPLEELLLPLHDADAARAEDDARLANRAGGRDSDERFSGSTREDDDTRSSSTAKQR